MIIQEIKIFLTAVMFYTRIPCPKWVDHDPTYINLSIRYFSLIGWIVGGLSGLTFYFGNSVFSEPIAIVLSMIASVLVTGAFHEDGFADVCDAFGGGWTKDKILTIMKDSRLGTYGVIGLFLMLSIKYLLNLEILSLMVTDWWSTMIFFILVHAASRFIASTFVFTHEYARDSNDSKAKPVAEQTGYSNLVIGFIWVLIPLLIWCNLLNNYWYLGTIFFAYASKYFLARYFKKWIGGYTGDCLGSTQQVSEIVIYMVILIIWKFV